jgi:hypothetical protein
MGYVPVFEAFVDPPRHAAMNIKAHKIIAAATLRGNGDQMDLGNVINMLVRTYYNS